MQRKLYGVLVIGIAMLMLLLACSEDDNSVAPELATEDRVLIQSITASTTDPVVSVAVDFVNLEPLTALEVPLSISGFGFTVDSVSFVNSRMNDAEYLIGDVRDGGSTILISAIHTTSATTAGNGKLAALYFSLDESSRGQVLSIDSMTVIESPVVHTLIYADTNSPAVEFVPEFVAGEVSVFF